VTDTSSHTPTTLHRAATPTGGPNAVWVWLSLVMLCAVAYLPGVNAPMVFDDTVTVRGNSSITPLWPIVPALQPPRDNTMAARPIVNLTMAVNFAIHQEWPAGYRLVNLSIHMTNVWLVFVILRRLLPRVPGLPLAGGQLPYVAWLIALVWAVHPMQVESVVYITQRTELMVALFSLLTLWLCLRCFAAQDDPGRRPIIWGALAVGACGLGMGSKEVMFVTPLLIFLIDRCLIAGSLVDTLKKHGLLYLCLAATYVYLFVLVTDDPRTKSVGLSHGVTVWNYLCAQAGIVGMYIYKMFWPYPQLIYYDWQRDAGLGDAWGFGSAILLLLGLMAWGLLRNRAVGVVLAWFFFILAPTSSVVVIVTEFAAERRMYLPMLSVLLLVLIPLAAWCMQAVHHPRGRRTLAAVVLAGLAVWTASYSWKHNRPTVLWENVLAHYPSSPAAINNYGTALAAEERQDESIRLYEQAIRLWPHVAGKPRFNLARRYMEKERYDVAAGHLLILLNFEPRNRKALFNLAESYSELGQHDKAMATALRLRQLDPNSGGALLLLARTARDAGWHELTDRYYMLAARRFDALAEPHFERGLVRFAQGDLEAAVAFYQKGLELNPDSAAGHVNLGLAYSRMGRLQEAVDLLQRGIELDPEHADGHNNLGTALARLGRLPEARDMFARAVALGHEGAKKNLAQAQALLSGQRPPD